MKKIMAIAILTGTLISICSMASAWEVVVRRDGHHRRHHHHHSYYNSRPRPTYVTYGYPSWGYYSTPYTVRRVYYPNYTATYRVDEVVDTYYYGY
ncbi:MAG: hypothetical protein RBU23_08305 [Candidatus Auribacterota bacterium]|jgi:hypothetical protein|nr:hypothetical protein [Candidatus Auribacterota bacterium]